MTIHATRTRLMGVIGTIIALIAVLFGASPVHAATGDYTLGDYTLEIHKFEQPDALGTAANGLPLDTTGLTPVPGATFTATRVPGIDLTTNEGQRQAATLGVDEAHTRITGKPAAGTVTTNALGRATVQGLESGLYYVVETFVPAGYVASTPFLVALPLTDPVQLDRLLDTVHVYPKNAKASITLDVIDADAIALGDTVHWTSKSTIPNQPNITGYQVDQVIDTKLEYTGNLTVGFDCDCGNLTEGTHYTVTFNKDTNTVTVDFTEQGLHKLEQAVAALPNSNVTMEYDTTVLAEGILENEAILYPSRDAIDERLGVNDTAVTKWGPLAVVVHEHRNPTNLIPDACFNVYASEADARSRTNPISVNGVSEWRTDSQGRFIVPGLRFSNFANGLDRATDDPLHRFYWAVPGCIPPGWTWVDDRPLAGIVNDVLEFQTLIFEVEKGRDLPVTGGQAAGIGVLGVLLLGGGAIMLTRRKRNRAEASTAR